MNSLLTRLAIPALVAACLGAFASPALAGSWRHRPIYPHHHIITTVTGNAPGDEVQPVTQAPPSYTVSNDQQLTAALKAAQPGQTIQLASGGMFSKIYDTKVRSGWVTISGAGDAVMPVIKGAILAGSRYLRFNGVEFTGLVYIQSNPVLKYAEPAENIQLLNSEVDCGTLTTQGGGTGIFVRGASQNIVISGDYVHDCAIGFSSEAQDNQSSNIVITHDLFQQFYGDAIDLGGLENVTIDHDIIDDIAHSPGEPYHDDAIQFFGNDTNVAITNNVIANCLDQLVFIQDAIKGTNNNSSVNSNILVQNNLIYGDSAVAIQDQGGVNGSFLNNTVWDNGDGSLLLRVSGYTGIDPTNTTIEHNVLETFMTIGVRPQVEQDNMILKDTAWWGAGPGDILGQQPTFANPGAGDFALVGGTPLQGTSQSTTAPSTTITPQLGDSLVQSPGYGAPQWGTQQ